MKNLIPDTGRPTLDRTLQDNTRENQETHDFYRDLAGQLSCGIADVKEGVARAAKVDPGFLATLSHHSLLAHNENKKYPKEIPSVVEPPEPELTPEVAYENLDEPLKNYAAKADAESAATAKPAALTPTQAEPEALSANLWTNLAPALTGRVSEQNFEIWLSSLRFVSADPIEEDKARLVLQVPNTHFQEYLAEHYTEVIQEELFRAHDKLFEIEFVVLCKEEKSPALPTPRQPPTPPTNSLLDLLIKEKVSSLDQLEALEDRELPKIYQARLNQARLRATDYKARPGDPFGAYTKGDVNQAQLAEEVAILKTLRLAEEAKRIENRKRRRALFAMCNTLEKMRQPGNPQSQRQYHRASHWETEGGVTRPEVKEAKKALKTPPKPFGKAQGPRDLS